MFTAFYTCRAPVSRVRRLLPLLAVLLLSACQPRPELHIAQHTWIGYETLPLARELGWLPDNVVLHRLENSTASARALSTGEVAVAALTLDEALRLRAALPALQVVLVMNESAGADVLLVRPEIGNLGDLTGSRIAFERSAVSELLLRRALADAGLTLDDVQLVDLPVTAHEAAYRAGDVDAVVSYPPGAARIRALGAVGLFDSSQIPGTILDVLVVDPDQLDGRREALAATVAAHFRALEHLRSSRDDAVYRIAALQASTAAEVRSALAGVRLPAASSVAAYLQPGGMLLSTAASLREQGLLGDASDSIGLDDLVDTRYLPRSASR